ncbi:MAG: PKD domain-containing protein [Bacteroidales bacterium]
MRDSFNSYLVILMISFLSQVVFHVSVEGSQSRTGRNILNIAAKETITPIEVSHGEVIRYTSNDGSVLTIELVNTSANILFTNRNHIQPDERECGRGMMCRARLLYEITAEVKVNGFPMTMRKYVGSQESLYEPYVINGVRIWFDAVSDLFEQDGGFLNTTRSADGRGNLILNSDQDSGFLFGDGDWDVGGTPNKKARFVLHDMSSRICPGEIHAWFKDGDQRDDNFIYKDNFIDIGRTYNGDDVYLGAYLGGESHGALDVVMAMNSTMYAPFDLDTQEGIRAKGTKRWPDGSVWAINTGHVIEKYVPDNTPVKGGTPYGRGARRATGAHPHAHFGFEILESGIRYDIDPWIIFWQHFEDNKKRDGVLRAMMEPFSHSKTGAKVNFARVCQSGDDQCSGISYYWSFGDGGWSDEPFPEYAYSRPGIYPVTLTIDNGDELASFTQHITVEGSDITIPSLVLTSDDEPFFRPRPLDMMDVYSWPVRFVPHTLDFLSRPSRPEPNTRSIEVENPGGGNLSSIEYGIDYRQDIGWINIGVNGEGNNQMLEVGVNGRGLPSGEYEAVISIHSDGALNSPQRLRVLMTVPDLPAQSVGVIIDDKDPEFYSTPYFWVGHRFHGHGWPELKDAEGFNNFYLINGERARDGEFARFTPDLEAGTYEVWLYEKTPFASGPPANNEPARFQTRIVHADGEDFVWLEPERMEGFYPRPYMGQEKWQWLEIQPSRKIGEFRFEEGRDGYIEILSGGSTGQVIVDAVRFLKMNY